MVNVKFVLVLERPDPNLAVAGTEVKRPDSQVPLRRQPQTLRPADGKSSAVTSHRVVCARNGKPRERSRVIQPGHPSPVGSDSPGHRLV